MKLSASEEAEAHIIAFRVLAGEEGGTFSATEAQAKRIFARAAEIVRELASAVSEETEGGAR